MNYQCVWFQSEMIALKSNTLINKSRQCISQHSTYFIVKSGGFEGYTLVHNIFGFETDLNFTITFGNLLMLSHTLSLKREYTFYSKLNKNINYRGIGMTV